MGIPEGEEELPPETIPADCSIQIRGLDTEIAQQLGAELAGWVRMISRYVELDRLDGITVAADYPEALAQLDRGYETNYVLTPTSELATGVAMSPAVFRNNVLKTHIVLNAAIVLPILNHEDEYWGEALHIVYHECAHVYVNKTLDAAFPGTILRQAYPDVMEACFGQIIDGSLEEYSACRLSAQCGADRTAAYVETFVLALRETRERANAHIRAYREHGDHGRILTEVGRQYGELIKFASYLIGHCHGADIEPQTLDAVKAALEDHWFAPYFSRLELAFSEIWARFGAWESRVEFAAIGEIAEEVIADGGMNFTRSPDGIVAIHLPFSPETMPEGAFT